jgi:hypothetical protein
MGLRDYVKSVKDANARVQEADAELNAHQGSEAEYRRLNAAACDAAEARARVVKGGK